MPHSDTFMNVISLVVRLGGELILELLKDGGRDGDLRVRDLSSWREWERRNAQPNFKKLLDEYRRR